MQFARAFTQQLAGTGAALNVNTNFEPALVIALNITDLSISIWLGSMGQGTCLQIKDSGAGTTDVLSVTTNGISKSPQGFVLGTDANLNSASDVIHVLAF